MEVESITIDFLPPEVMVNVFCRLDVVTLVRDVARVCSTWRATLTYDTIFQRIFIRQFGLNATHFKQQMDLDQFTWRSLLVNRVRADMWTNKVAQAPKQLPQSKKVVNIIPLTGIPRTFLVQTERDPPMWKWLSIDESSAASSSSKGVVAGTPVDIYSVLLPGFPEVHTRLGAVTSVVVNPIDPTSREAGMILSSLTIGTLHGYVASFYYRSWGGASTKEGNWILTATYRHLAQDNPQATLGVRPIDANIGIVGLWATDDVIMAVSEDNQFSFWNRTTAGDSAQQVATISKNKNQNVISKDNIIQLQMARVHGRFCRHTSPWTEPNFRGEVPESTETCERACTLIRSNRLKPEAGRPVVSLPPTTSGCASQVVFSLGGAISIWAFHASRGKNDDSYSATVQITPKQILSALGGNASSESFSILQARLLDDFQSTIRPGLGYRNRLVTLIQFGPKQSKQPQPVILALWQLEYVPAGTVPRLLTATPLGAFLTPEHSSFDVGAPFHVFSFFKSNVVMVVSPQRMILVGLSTGQTLEVWDSDAADVNLAKFRITAVSCREDLGVVVTTFTDLSMCVWSAETGGLPIRTINRSATATSWLSSTRLPLRAISATDPFFFAALDPHCIYLRQLKKY